jgi:hypothetical protein
VLPVQGVTINPWCCLFFFSWYKGEFLFFGTRVTIDWRCLCFGSVDFDDGDSDDKVHANDVRCA